MGDVMCVCGWRDKDRRWGWVGKFFVYNCIVHIHVYIHVCVRKRKITLRLGRRSTATIATHTQPAVYVLCIMYRLSALVGWRLLI